MSPHSLTSKYLTQVKPVNLHTAKNLVNNMTRKCLCETKLLHIMGANSSGLSRREVDALYLTSNEVQLFISNSGPCHHLLLDLYSLITKLKNHMGWPTFFSSTNFKYTYFFTLELYATFWNLFEA